MSGLASPIVIDLDPAPEASRFHCVACGHQRAGRSVRRVETGPQPFDLVRCGDCGLVQEHPRRSHRQLVHQYESDYYVFTEDESLRWARAVQQYAVHLLRWEARPGLRLLDLGCALGHLSVLARRRGWRVVGLDISAEAVSRAAARFDIDVRAGTLAQHRETLPPFDLVFLGDVIEHVADPARFLRRLYQVLTPDGRICIDTPNWSSRWRRWGGRHWVGLNACHINLFDADSLGRLLSSCGYCEVKTGGYTNSRYESWAHRPEVQAVVQSLPRAVAWRVNRFLARRTGRTRWATLRRDPPTTLEASLGRLNELTQDFDLLHGPRPGDDNLIATALKSARPSAENRHQRVW